MATRRITSLSVDRLRELIEYNSDTGVFRWRTTGKGKRSIAGSTSRNKRGVCRTLLTVEGTRVGAHVWAWYYMTGKWPDCQVDHRDRNPRNNQFSNLRLATHSENLRNTRRRKDNTSGFKGVYWSKQKRKWCAQIGGTGAGRHRTIGFFRNKEDAAKAYDIEAKKAFCEFASPNFPEVHDGG